MPLIKFHVIKGQPKSDLNALLDTAHHAMIRSFKVPERDLYQILTEHEPEFFRAQDTGLDIKRTNRFVLVEVVSRPRARELKVAFYENLCKDLKTNCNIDSSDIMVSFVENSNEDWSFGLGRAQFLTGELES